MPLADTLNRKPGDILKSDDWNVIIKEIDRKINRDGADTLKGPLTITEALKVNSSVIISGNLSVTNVLEIGDPPSAVNTGGNRDWMQKGIKINWDSDSLFIGLKNEGTNRKDAVIAWGDDPQDDLRFVNVLARGEVQGKELMRIKPSGNVGIGTNNPIASLDIASASRTGTHPTAVKGLYITGDFNADNDGVEFRHSSGTQGIGFGFNTIYAAGSNDDQDLQLKPKGTGEVKVAGSLSVSGIVKAQTLTVSGDLSVTGSVSFGSQARQMLNLYGTVHGIGVQNNTTYFRTSDHFAWYKGGSHNDTLWNTGTGGTSLMTLDSNGNLSVSGIVEIGSLQLGGFTSEDKDEWLNVFWSRDLNQNWDEGLIKHSSSRGVFKKAGFGIHFHQNREFGFWSTGWNPLFAVEGDTGNTYIRGNLDLQGSAFLGYESDISNFGTPLKSGFYQNGGGSEIPGDVPDISNPWTHLITARHSNTSNNYQLQIASTFTDNDRLFFRKVAAGLETNNPGWKEVATRGKNTFVGNQIIDGNLDASGTLKVNGAITPSVGNSENNGIMFPINPGGRGGDAAWIRYYVRGGEATTFEIGTSNDSDDHIALMPNAGNVGIGTSTPNDKLDVAGSLRILTGSNPIRFTSVWSAFPDAVTNQAEISNDTGNYKTLMIVGNSSANLGRRVSIWDRLEVNGQLEVKGNGNTFRISVEGNRVVFYLSNAYHGTNKQISWDGDNNWDPVS